MERSSVTGHQGLLEGTVDIYRVGQQRRLHSGKVMCHELPAVDQLRAVHLEWEDKQRCRCWECWQGEERALGPSTLSTPCCTQDPYNSDSLRDIPCSFLDLTGVVGEYQRISLPVFSSWSVFPEYLQGFLHAINEWKSHEQGEFFPGVFSARACASGHTAPPPSPSGGSQD